MFNLINGVYPPDGGSIVFAGQDITGGPPYRVARQGIARAHQIVQPLGGLSVLDNCTVGACFGRQGLGLVPARKIAREVVDMIGLGDRPDMLAASLTTAGKKPPSNWRVPCRRARACCYWTRCSLDSIRPKPRE